MLEYEIHGGKAGAESPHTPVETPNNLLSVAYAKVLVAVAEGELAGNPTARDIFLDGTPLQNADGSNNFGGVTWEWRNGTVDQEYIKGVPDVSNEITVGFDLTTANPYVRNITKTTLDAVRVTFQWPALLRQLQDGDTVGYSIKYAVDISTDGGPFVEYKQYEVRGKTNTTYERTHRVDLPKATIGWSFRARRTTPDSSSSMIQDSMTVKSITEVVDVKQRYPNTALLFVQFDSRLFGNSSIPKISVKTKGRVIQVPTNYDPESRNYAGVWDGSFKWAWSDNPAWVFYDIVLQDRFGLGNKVDATMIDKWALYEVAQYCDVMVDDGTGSGTMEPRHTCNVYLQSQEDAWKVLRDIASIFNGMTYWNGKQFVAIADKQEPLDNIPIFSRSNVIGGTFNYQAADDKSIYTSALISYDEPTNHYQTEVEAVWEKSQILRWGGDRQTSLSAIGCTSRGEAQRKGKYTLLTNMFTRTVTFQTGLQGLNDDILPGKIIGVADPLIGGKPFTGRIKVAAGKVITLDRDIEAVAGDLLFITNKDGSSQPRTIQAVAGNIVTLTVAYTEQPLPNAVWYLESSTLKSQLFRVTRISSPSESIYEIEAVEYNDSKYAAIDNGARLEPRPISVVPPGIQAAPVSVSVSSNSYIEQTMAVTNMVVSWPKTANAVLYEGQWLVDDGDWVTLGTTGGQDFTVKGIYSGTYLVRIRAINAGGVKSVWKLSEATTLVGKEGAPPAVTSLTASPLIYGIGLDWTFPEGATDTARTEIMYSQTTAFADAIKLGDYAYPQDSHELHGLLAGQRFYFWVRLVDRTGNIGAWYPSDTAIGVVGQAATNTEGIYNDYFAGLITDTALNEELNNRIDLIDGVGPGSVNERIDTAVTDLEGQIAAITDALVYDPTKAYLTGEIVRSGNRLYQAIDNVPINTPPPNEVYWKDVGVILEEANALAAQVTINTADIDVIDGKLTSAVSQVNSLQAAFRDDDAEGELNGALEGWTSSAKIIEESKVRATEDEAMASKLTVVQAQVNNNTSTISSLSTTVSNNASSTASQLNLVNSRVDATETSIASEATTRATADTALGLRIDTTEASIASNTARIQTVETAQVTTDSSLATLTTKVSSVSREDGADGELDSAINGWNSSANYAKEVTTRTSENEALAKSVETVQVNVNNNTSSIQTISQAQATQDGKLSSMWAVKMQVNAQGQYVAAGIGLGIENGPAGLQSQFLVQADRFAVVNNINSTVSAPFVVTGGQVFIRDAFIANGSITMLKIGEDLQSDNYVEGVSGWRLTKSGSFKINGSVAGQGKMVMTNRSLRVYDGAGVKRVQLGDLTE